MRLNGLHDHGHIAQARMTLSRQEEKAGKASSGAVVGSGWAGPAGLGREPVGTALLRAEGWHRYPAQPAARTPLLGCVPKVCPAAAPSFLTWPPTVPPARELYWCQPSLRAFPLV